MIDIGSGALALDARSRLLHAALALSCASGRPFRWKGFGRKSSGLSAPDSEAIRFFSARVERDAVVYEPEALRAGEHPFDVSPGVPMPPLLRAALLPLARAGGECVVRLNGATHAPDGETFEVVDSTFRYLLQRIGIDVSFVLDCAGFAPRGGGEVTARIGSVKWTPLTLNDRDPLERIQIVSAGASLPAHVQQRQAARARSGVHIAGFEPTVQLLKIRARSAGSVVAVTGHFGEFPVTFASVSERGKSAESVGERAATSFRRYASQPAVVPGALVEALLPFLAFADGESELTTPALPASAAGQAALITLIRVFTDRGVDIEGKAGRPGRIRVSGLQT